ncbi:uncharacterized protein LOC142529130 [Primulina tabacum]|uniref:uncharacterized protein LOC142529130 n=1 Tax=Primulina tabacum TaxID=48773 RepID=UPI003F5A7A22
MGRAPCCDKANVKKGPWSPEEDAKLKEYIEKHGTGGNWISLPLKADLRRCGKSCRLRWLNYLRPNIRHGEFSDDEDRVICSLFASIGSRWSIIAAQLPGRTDNDIKNYWNTKLKKKILLGASKSYQLLSKININPIQRNPSISSPYPSLETPFEYGKITTYPTNISEDIKVFSDGTDPISPTFPTTVSSNPTTHSVFQAQNHGYLSLTQYDEAINCNNNTSNYIMFGGEASCTSSDVSSDGENLNLQKYLYNNGIDIEGDQKFLINNPGGFGADLENPLDYSIEEIKQLISSNSICSDDLFVDGIKTEEQVLYY